MHFTPKEQDKLTLLCVGLIAERRLKKGLKLNYPESVAYITSSALEMAREGKTVEEVMHEAAQSPSSPTARDWSASIIPLSNAEKEEYYG